MTLLLFLSMQTSMWLDFRARAKDDLIFGTKSRNQNDAIIINRRCNVQCDGQERLTLLIGYWKLKILITIMFQS